MIISKRFTKRLGLQIRTGEEYATELEFVDDSIMRTSGMVLSVDWRFFSDTTYSSPVPCDFHVLKDLPCDVVLSNEFLYDNQVFSDYRDCFFDLEDSDLSSLAELGLIQERRKHRSLKQVFRDIFNFGSGRGMWTLSTLTPCITLSRYHKQLTTKCRRRGRA
jgi:hypothetical protein